MNTQLTGAYFPSIYRGFKEVDEIVTVENFLFDVVAQEFLSFQNNQFVVTADADGVAKYEQMYKIVPNLLTETLEFRKQRIVTRFSGRGIYTLGWLRTKLNEIIGVGKYDLLLGTDFTLVLMSSAVNQVWFNELHTIVNGIKPANIVFINKPYLANTVLMSETVEYNAIIYNYRLGTTWNLGQKNFRSTVDMGAIKLAEVPSIQGAFIDLMLDYADTLIGSILINNSVSITAFVTVVTSTEVEITYTVMEGQVTEVTNIKLMAMDGITVLSSSDVYVPISEDTEIINKILIKEGV